MKKIYNKAQSPEEDPVCMEKFLRIDQQSHAEYEHEEGQVSWM